MAERREQSERSVLAAPEAKVWNAFTLAGAGR